MAEKISDKPDSHIQIDKVESRTPKSSESSKELEE